MQYSAFDMQIRNAIGYVEIVVLSTYKDKMFYKVVYDVDDAKLSKLGCTSLMEENSGNCLLILERDPITIIYRKKKVSNCENINANFEKRDCVTF